MSSSSHQIKVKATDQTAGAFASIQKRAQAAGANIKKMLGGALVAAGGYLGVKAFLAGADELGRLSDIAMKASTSVDELTQAETAMKILGLNTDVNSLATAFAKMAQTTGRTGMAGFYKTIEELGKIEDVSKRSQMAMKIFGRAGLEFMPLANAAKEGTSALQTLIDAMPKVSQAAANAGDALSDAKTIGVTGFQRLWLEAVGKISKTIDEQFKGGIREAAMDGVSYFTYFAKLSYARIQWLFNSVGILAGAISANWSNVMTDMESMTKSFLQHQGTKLQNVGIKLLDKSGLSEFILGHKINVTKGNSTAPIKEAAKSLWQNVNGEELLKELDSLISKEDKLREALATQLDKNAQAAEAYNKAAMSTGDRKTLDGINASGGKPKIDNKLILGGSNDALKLSLLGPQTKEMQKQTNLLKEIRDNTKETASNTDDLDSGVFDLTELN